MNLSDVTSRDPTNLRLEVFKYFLGQYYYGGYILSKEQWTINALFICVMSGGILLKEEGPVSWAFKFEWDHGLWVLSSGQFPACLGFPFWFYLTKRKPLFDHGNFCEYAGCSWNTKKLCFIASACRNSSLSAAASVQPGGQQSAVCLSCGSSAQEKIWSISTDLLFRWS